MWAWLYWCGVDVFRWRNTQPRVNRLFNSARTCSFRCGCALMVRVSVFVCVSVWMTQYLRAGADFVCLCGVFRIILSHLNSMCSCFRDSITAAAHIRALSLLFLISANGINVKLSIWLEEIEIEINLIGMKCCAVLSVCECATVCVWAYV